MLLVFLLCVLVCVSAVLLRRARARELRAHPLPPAYPGALPIVGHAHKLLGDTEHIWEVVKLISHDSIRQGGVTFALVGSSIYYLITDPNDALTASNLCLQKHFGYDYGKPWLGNGLITGSGEVWKRHRKLLNPAFSLPVINGFLGVFNEQSRQLLSEMALHVGKGKFDPSMYFRKIFFQTFCLTAFGVGGVNKEILEKYMEAVDKILFLITTRFLTVYLHNDFIYKLSGYKNKMAEAVDVLKKISTEIIEKKKAAMKTERNMETESDMKSLGRYKPLFDLLLSMEDTLTDKEIREEIDTAIVAGFDTTSVTTLYISVLLGSYPDVQERLYDEIMTVLGPDKDVEKDDINRLVYTEAVIKETVRCFPVGPALMRYVDKDVKLKNYTMRAGSYCVLLPVGTHQHAVWGADSQQFRPERWLDAAAMPDNAGSFGGFSWGKRNCIGKTYAITTMKVTIAHFIRRYRVTADVSKLKLKLDGVLKPASAYEISIECRN